MSVQEKPFRIRPFSLGYLIFLVFFTSVMLLLEWNITASYPPEYSGLRVQNIIGLLFMIGHTQMVSQIYEWASETVTEGKMVSRNRFSLAVFTLCLTSALVVAWCVYCSQLIMATFLLVWLFVFNLFPIYILLRRKIIPKKWLLLTTLAFIACFFVLMWFLSQNQFQVSDSSYGFYGFVRIMA